MPHAHKIALQYEGRPLEVYGDLVHVGDVLFKDITAKVCYAHTP